MTDSREDSPDWLRSFQPPTRSAIELSSGSESSLVHSPVIDDEDGINLSKLFNKEATRVSVKGNSPKKTEKVEQTPKRKRKGKNEDGSEREGKKAKANDINRRDKPEKHEKAHEQNYSIWSLSSDSESSPGTKPDEKDKTTKTELSANEEDLVTEYKEGIDDILLNHNGESPAKRVSKVRSPMKKLEKMDEKTLNKKNIHSRINGENDTDNNFVKEEVFRKHTGPQVSSSTVPLLLPEKVQRSKALVECEGDSIDLSGDVGAVGRVIVSDDPLKNHETFLDLKGTIYKTTIVPSRTFCVVSFGQSEAKIEAIMNDYIQLKPQSNVYEAETMVEGTLDGFSFDSEDEADKATAQANQNEVEDEQLDAKTKGKSEKTSGVGRKKGKPAGGKPSKKAKKKPQVSKKGKSKK